MTSVVSIFCEDIREEKTGQDTIIGILPDNMLIPHIPGALPKLCVYVRVHLDIENSPQIISASLLNSDGAELALQTWEKSVIDKAFSDAKANAMPVVGLVLKAVMGPFPISAIGKIVSKLRIDDVEFVGGALNLIFSGRTESVPQPSQSEPTAPA
jgi:hypothetical protein